jgi:hypothetical protein
MSSTLINHPNSKVLRTARKLALDRTSRTIYVPVDENIYFNGMSYRVRVTRDGLRTSKNFHSRKKAVKFRNQLFNLSYQLV